MIIRPFHLRDEASVVDLWSRCDLLRPQNDPYLDIRRKLLVQPEMFLIAEVESEIIGSVMCGYDGHRGWINYLAVHPNHRGQGVGRRLMEKAESALRELQCPKINLQVRSANQSVIAFYEKLGFSVDEVISMGKRIDTK